MRSLLIGLLLGILVAAVIFARRKRTKALRYAVTVSHEGGRFLLLDIRRHPDEIFFNWPKLWGGPRQWRPHTSVHQDGTIHQKDFGRKSMARRGPRPDASFVGTENITGLAMNPGQWRTINKAFDPSRFAGALDIDVVKLSLDTRRTQLQLDLTEPGAGPKLIGGAAVLQQGFFKGARPWVALTLIDEA
jgi:hypothetical protein